MDLDPPTTDERPLSRLPSPLARALAFAAIVLAGLLGALIGWALVDIQCRGDCSTASAIGTVVGGVVAAGGVAIVAVIALRAMGEWKRIKEAELFNEEPDGQGSTSRRKPSA